MKKIKGALLRAAALTAAAVISVLSLFSCAGGGGVPAVEYNGVTVDEEMYAYLMTHYKTAFLASYEGASDTAAFWDHVRPDGKTNEQYLNEVALENVKKYVASTWMFNYMDRKFTREMKEDIEAGIDSIIEDAFDGDEAAFEEHLSKIGTSRRALYEVYAMDVRSEYLYEYLYGVSGTISVPDSDRLAYTKETYSHIKHIYVNDAFGYQLDENGNYIYDEDGYAVKAELTDEQKAAAAYKLQKIDEGIENGVDFDDLRVEYSDETGYPDGYYLTRTTNYIEEIIDAAFEMEIGEVRRFDTDNGKHYIKRVEIEGEPWNNADDADFFDGFEDNMRAYLYAVMVDGYTDGVVVDEEVTGRHSIRDAVTSRYV